MQNETQKELELLAEADKAVKEVKNKWGKGKVVIFINDSEVRGFEVIMSRN